MIRHRCFQRVALAALCLLGTVMFAQENEHRAKLTGKVFDDETGIILPGVELHLPELRMGTTTNSRGEFSLVLPTGQYRMVVSLLGYASDTLAVKVWRDQELTLYLVPTAIQLSSVTVTAVKPEDSYLTTSTRSLDVISTKELVATRGQTLGQTLTEIPGVTLLNTGPSIAKPVIRGLHSDRVVVINGGVAQEGQQWGGEHAPEIDPFSAEKIEVLKGAAGVAYGAGAIGGVIRVEPRSLRRVPGIDGFVALNGFSNNRQGAGSLMLEGMTKYVPGLTLRLQGTARRAGNSSSPSYVLGNTGFSETVGSGTIGYDADGTQIEVQYSLFETELGIYKGSHIGSLSDLERALAVGRPLAEYNFTYRIQPPEQKISHELWSVNAEQEIHALGSLEIQFGRQSNHRQEFDAFRFFNNEQTLPTVPSFELTLTTYSLDLRFKHRPIGQWIGVIGLSGIRQGNVRGGYTFLIPGFRVYSGGAYAIEQWMNDKLTVNMGARYDFRWLKVYPNSSKQIPEATHAYENVSGSIGCIYQIDPLWSLGLNIGSAFRPPGVNELYSDGVHHGTAEYEKGDPGLKNERSYSLDMTLKGGGALTRGEISGYYNSIDNFIFLYPNSQPVLTLRGTFPAFSYEQADAVLFGFDGSIRHKISDFDEVGLSASLVRGTNRTTRQPLFQMPADRIHVSNTLSLPSMNPFRNPSVEVGVTLVRRQDRFQPGVDYVDPPPGYGLVELNARWEMVIGGHLCQTSFSVSNMFNKSYRDYLSRYRYFVDDPGRDITVRIQIPFGQTP